MPDTYAKFLVAEAKLIRASQMASPQMLPDSSDEVELIEAPAMSKRKATDDTIASSTARRAGNS